MVSGDASGAGVAARLRAVLDRRSISRGAVRYRRT
jgi:hypothetical protein